MMLVRQIVMLVKEYDDARKAFMMYSNNRDQNKSNDNVSLCVPLCASVCVRARVRIPSTRCVFKRSPPPSLPPSPPPLSHSPTHGGSEGGGISTDGVRELQLLPSIGVDIGTCAP